MPVSIDPRALKEALGQQLPVRVETLLDIEHIDQPGSPVSALDALVSEHAGEVALDALLPSWTRVLAGEHPGCEAHHMGVLVASMWFFLLENLPDFAPEDVTIEGDTVLSEPLVVTGDLHVKGDLQIPMSADGDTYDLIILGDLRVDGSLRFDYSKLLIGGSILCGEHFDERGDWSIVATRGGVRAGGIIASSGELYAGGIIEAPLITLTYNHGHAVLMGGARAVVFYSRDHRGWLASRPDALAWDEGDMILVEKRAEPFEDEQGWREYAQRHLKGQGPFYPALYSCLAPSFISAHDLQAPSHGSPPDGDKVRRALSALFTTAPNKQLGLTAASSRDFEDRKNQNTRPPP